MTEPKKPNWDSLKIDASKAKFAKKSKEKEDFQVQAEEFNSQLQEKKQKALELSQSFLELLKNKTLLQNKGPLEQNLEKDIIKKLTEFAIEINNDPNELEGMGSVGINVILLKSLLNFRDALNAAEYKIYLLEQQIKTSQDLDGK